MGEDRKTFKIKDGNLGEVKIADEVVATEPEFDLLVYVRLHRVGFNFEGDSRSYVRLPDTKILHSYDVDLVDGEPHLGLNKIVEILDKEFPDVL